MKEPERQKLQDALNHKVLAKIIYVQHFFRTQQERRQRQAAAIVIQVRTEINGQGSLRRLLLT